jgi:hypothetical protein
MSQINSTAEALEVFLRIYHADSPSKNDIKELAFAVAKDAQIRRAVLERQQQLEGRKEIDWGKILSPNWNNPHFHTGVQSMLERITAALSGKPKSARANQLALITQSDEKLAECLATNPYLAMVILEEGTLEAIGGSI